MPGNINPFGLCGPTFQTRDQLWANERAINWLPNVDDSGGDAHSKVELAPTPGLAFWSTVSVSPIRGFWVGDNRLFAVAGNELHEFFADGTHTYRAGPMTPAGTPVQIAADGLSLLIANGAEIWWTTGAGPSAKVQDGISAVYIDGYYVILKPDSNVIQWAVSTDAGYLVDHGSGPVVESNWNPLDVIEKRGTLDRSVHLEVHEGHLWVFGRKSIVPYYDTGDDPVFAPIPGATMDVGTMAPWSVCKIDMKLYWLGNDEHGWGRVYRSDGYTPTRISNQAIESLIRQYLLLGTDERITGSGYEENGHTFYVLSFPLAKATLVYDLTTSMWHERARWTGSAWDHWRGASFHAFVFNKHLVARISGGPFTDEHKIYEQSMDLYTDDGDPIRRYRTAPYVAHDQQWMFHHYLRLFTNSDPAKAIDMRYLYDDETTWSNTRSITPYKHEVKYRRLGRARDRLYEVSLLDSATQSTSIIEAYLHATPGVQR